jgi:hypothetical protein
MGGDGMDEKEKVKAQVEGELVKCESRIKELRGPAKTKGMEKELDTLETELQGCKLALDGLLKKRAGEWENAKVDVVKRLNGLARSLDTTTRRIL